MQKLLLCQPDMQLLWQEGGSKGPKAPLIQTLTNA